VLHTLPLLERSVSPVCTVHSAAQLTLSVVCLLYSEVVSRGVCYQMAAATTLPERYCLPQATFSSGYSVQLYQSKVAEAALSPSSLARLEILISVMTSANPGLAYIYI
jgi:hypothetical protein